MIFSRRGTTGSCLPLSWRWRRWARWMKDSTLALPSIPLSSRSARDAPSPSPFCLVKKDTLDLPEQVLLSFILARASMSSVVISLFFFWKLVWAFFVSGWCQHPLSKNNVLFPLQSASQQRPERSGVWVWLHHREHIQKFTFVTVKPLNPHISEEVGQCRGLSYLSGNSGQL